MFGCLVCFALVVYVCVLLLIVNRFALDCANLFCVCVVFLAGDFGVCDLMLLICFGVFACCLWIQLICCFACLFPV